EDFNLPIMPIYVPVTLIRDGKVLWDELNDLGFDESWLKTQLETQEIFEYHSVFLAEWLENDGLFIQTY
ncbi:YetF domain-containing protein, partial [Priestia megaterium]